MRRLGMPVSDTTILARLKENASARSESSAMAAVHVAGVDDWAWRKGSNYGTIIVDLERRKVVDVLGGSFGGDHGQLVQGSPGRGGGQPRSCWPLWGGRA